MKNDEHIHAIEDVQMRPLKRVEVYYEHLMKSWLIIYGQDN
jgi:hypothetical protein